MIETPIGDISTPYEDDIASLRGRLIVRVEHDGSNGDEELRLILDNGVKVTIGTSEWLSITFHQATQGPAHSGG